MNNIYWKLRNTLGDLAYSTDLKNIILTLLFFKFITRKMNDFIKQECILSSVNYQTFEEDPIASQIIKQKCLEELGFYIDKKYTYDGIIKEYNENGNWINETFKKAMHELENSPTNDTAKNIYNNLFKESGVNFSVLGDTNFKITNLLLHIIELIDKEDPVKLFEEWFDNSRMYRTFTREPNDSDNKLTILVTKLLESHPNAIVYDPVCDNSSLLVNYKKNNNCKLLLGQCIDNRKLSLSKMNLLIHNCSYKDFLLTNGNSFIENNFENYTKNIDICVSILSFSRYRMALEEYDDIKQTLSNRDSIFNHIINMLNEKGKAIIAVPYNFLHSAIWYEDIRKKIVKNNYLKSVIAIPSDNEYSYRMCAIIILEKNKSTNDVFFIDTTKFKTKKIYGKNFSNDIVDLTVRVESEIKEIEGVSKIIKFEEIENNNYDLAVEKYIINNVQNDNAEYEDIENELATLENEIKATEEKISQLIMKLRGANE